MEDYNYAAENGWYPGQGPQSGPNSAAAQQANSAPVVIDARVLSALSTIAGAGAANSRSSSGGSSGSGLRTATGTVSAGGDGGMSAYQQATLALQQQQAANSLAFNYAQLNQNNNQFGQNLALDTTKVANQVNQFGQTFGLQQQQVQGTPIDWARLGLQATGMSQDDSYRYAALLQQGALSGDQLAQQSWYQAQQIGLQQNQLSLSQYQTTSGLGLDYAKLAQSGYQISSNVDIAQQQLALAQQLGMGDQLQGFAKLQLLSESQDLQKVVSQAQIDQAAQRLGFDKIASEQDYQIKLQNMELDKQKIAAQIAATQAQAGADAARATAEMAQAQAALRGVEVQLQLGNGNLALGAAQLDWAKQNGLAQLDLSREALGEKTYVDTQDLALRQTLGLGALAQQQYATNVGAGVDIYRAQMAAATQANTDRQQAEIARLQLTAQLSGKPADYFRYLAVLRAEQQPGGGPVSAAPGATGVNPEPQSLENFLAQTGQPAPWQGGGINWPTPPTFTAPTIPQGTGIAPFNWPGAGALPGTPAGAPAATGAPGQPAAPAPAAPTPTFYGPGNVPLVPGQSVTTGGPPAASAADQAAYNALLAHGEQLGPIAGYQPGYLVQHAQQLGLDLSAAPLPTQGQASPPYTAPSVTGTPSAQAPPPATPPTSQAPAPSTSTAPQIPPSGGVSNYLQAWLAMVNGQSGGSTGGGAQPPAFQIPALPPPPVMQPAPTPPSYTVPALPTAGGSPNGFDPVGYVAAQQAAAQAAAPSTPAAGGGATAGATGSPATPATPGATPTSGYWNSYSTTGMTPNDAATVGLTPAQKNVWATLGPAGNAYATAVLSGQPLNPEAILGPRPTVGASGYVGYSQYRDNSDEQAAQATWDQQAAAIQTGVGAATYQANSPQLGSWGGVVNNYAQVGYAPPPPAPGADMSWQNASVVPVPTAAAPAPRPTQAAPAPAAPLPNGVGVLAGTAQANYLAPPIPSYDAGTLSVPYDQLAYVHAGERITPAAENPYAQYETDPRFSQQYQDLIWAGMAPTNNWWDTRLSQYGIASPTAPVPAAAPAPAPTGTSPTAMNNAVEPAPPPGPTGSAPAPAGPAETQPVSAGAPMAAEPEPFDPTAGWNQDQQDAFARWASDNPTADEFTLQQVLGAIGSNNTLSWLNTQGVQQSWQPQWSPAPQASYADPASGQVGYYAPGYTPTGSAPAPVEAQQSFAAYQQTPLNPYTGQPLAQAPAPEPAPTSPGTTTVVTQPAPTPPAQVTGAPGSTEAPAVSYPAPYAGGAPSGPTYVAPGLPAPFAPSAPSPTQTPAAPATGAPAGPLAQDPVTAATATITRLLGGMPEPDDIPYWEWQNFDPTEKEMLLAAYEAIGWEKADVEARIERNAAGSIAGSTNYAGIGR